MWWCFFGGVAVEVLQGRVVKKCCGEVLGRSVVKECCRELL